MGGFAISRRDFLGVAGVGGACFLTLLPKALDGGVLFPTTAYADETGELIEDFEIVVLTPWSVGIYVEDVVNKVGVAGATVSLSSYVSGLDPDKSTLTEVTDSQGRAYFDIRYLSGFADEPPENNEYTFWGKIEVTPPSATGSTSYRYFETQKVWVTGASGLTAPTQMRDGKPYPSSIGINGFDAVYEESKYCLSKYNDFDHSFYARLRDLTPSSQVKAQFYQIESDGTQTLKFETESSTTSADGICEFTHAGQFFYNIDSNEELLFSIDDLEKPVGVSFACDTNSDGIDDLFYGAILSLGAKASGFDDCEQFSGSTAPTEGESEGALLCVASGTSSANEEGASIDFWEKSLLGDFFSLNIPGTNFAVGMNFPYKIPIYYTINPSAGFYCLTIGQARTKGEWDFSENPDGEYNPDAWKEMQTGVGKKLSEATLGDVEESKSKKNNSSDMAATSDEDSELQGGWGLILGVSIVGEIADSAETFTADEVVTHLFGDEANLESVDQEALSSENVLGSLGFSIGAFGSLECTQEMAIGPIPTFMSIDAKAAIEFDIMVSFSKSDAGEVLNFNESKDTTWGNTELSLHFTPEIMLIVGVGVKGFASLCLSGGVSIPIDLEFLGTTKDKTIGIAAVVEVFAQFLFFKASYTVYDDTMANVYSNNDSASIPSAPVGDRRFLLRSKSGGDELQYSTSSTNDANLGALFHGSTEDVAAWGELFSVVGSTDLKNTIEWKETLSSSNDDSSAMSRAFEYVNNSNTVRSFPQSAVLGGFKDGVVVPDSDVVIADDVYSNPRAKYTALQDKTLFFRIGTVNVVSDESSYRPRVVIDIVDGDSVTSLKPIEFDVPSEFDFVREDMYDYEFDVSVGEDRNVFIMITGGLIPSGDNAVFSEVVNASLVSFAELSFDESYDDYSVTWSSVHDLQSFYETAYYDLEGNEVSSTNVPDNLKTSEDYTISYKESSDALYHLVVQPKILYRKTDVWGGGISALAFAFIHRSADTADKLLTNQASSRLQANVISTTGAFSSASYEIDSGAFEIQMIPISIDGNADSNTGVVVFSTIDPASSTEEVVVGSVDCFTLLADGYTPYADPQIKLVRNVRSAPTPASPQPWWGNSGYLVAKDGQLCHYTYDPEVYDVSDFTKTRLDLDGCGTTQFVVNDAGDQIVYIDSFTPGYKYNPDTEEWELMGDPRYQISMTRAFTDTENEEGVTFCKPYKFAALEYPADHIFTFGSTTATAGLLINQIEDASNSTSCLHAIKVPYVAKFEVTDCVSKNSFVMAGAGTAGSDVPAESFYVSMKNIGNLCIVGFTAVMYDSSGEEISSYTVEQIDASEMVLNGDDLFGKNNVKSDNPDEMLVVVCDDPDQKVATMSDSKINGCIMPGEEFKYRVEFAIPETWAGSQTIRVEIVDHVVLGQTRTVQVMCSENSSISYKQLLHEDSGATYRFGDLAVDEIMTENSNGTTLTTMRTSFDDLLQHDIPVAEMEFSSAEFTSFGLTEDGIDSGDSDDSDDSAGSGSSDGSGSDSGQEGSDSAGLPQTGDGSGFLGVGALALGAGAAGLLAYSRRRTALENGEEV